MFFSLDGWLHGILIILVWSVLNKLGRPSINEKLLKLCSLKYFFSRFSPPSLSLSLSTSLSSLMSSVSVSLYPSFLT